MSRQNGDSDSIPPPGEGPPPQDKSRSGEGSQSALDALKKARIPPPAPGKDPKRG